ncbi:MAG: phenylacetate--CoA ligase family protein [Chloroflexi bacterium]|nr:phenylacetate--CoA ligase family protein [Chloroflexota bacterium]
MITELPLGYWNPKNELMPREELEALQLKKLRRVVERAYHKSPFHRTKFDEAGFKPEQLRSLADIERIPFTTKEEWLQEQQRHPLFGDMLTTSPDLAIRYHSTSGTSGRTPLRVLDSIRDWQWISDMWGYAFYGFGIRSTDIVYLSFAYGAFIGFWGAHYCCEKLGALTVASGGMSSEGRIKQILELGATTICATPTYALRLAQVASEMGIDLAKDSKVDKIILSGEPGGSVPSTKRLIETAWSAKAADTAGMTEIGTLVVFECSKQPGGTHIIEDHLIDEVIDPKTGGKLGYGERGERVVTSFGRGFIPLIRYRTGDLVEKVPGTSCTCGRTFDLYKGGILGRVDDMKLIRGTNVFPSAVEAIVREFEAVDEFQIALTREEGIRDEITVAVELKPSFDDQFPMLSVELGKALAEGHEGLRFNVRLAERGSLPRFELKARRLIDKREV